MRWILYSLSCLLHRDATFQFIYLCSHFRYAIHYWYWVRTCQNRIFALAQENNTNYRSLTKRFSLNSFACVFTFPGIQMHLYPNSCNFNAGYFSPLTTICSHKSQWTSWRFCEVLPREDATRGLAPIEHLPENYIEYDLSAQFNHSPNKKNSINAVYKNKIDSDVTNHLIYFEVTLQAV